jgi:hypothetical protein
MFEQQLVPLNDIENQEQFIKSLKFSVDSLKSYLQNAVLLVAKEFDPQIKGEDIFYDFANDAVKSQKLLRDIWMFKQILRAFIAKTKGNADVTDQWAGTNTFKFVKTFVTYFKSMGYQLLRYSDYDHFDRFMVLIERLRDGDVLEIQRLPKVIKECEDFYNYLSLLFEDINQKEELAGITFDKKEAARTLRLFLGHKQNP